MLQCLYVVESENFPLHVNGSIQPVSATPLHGRLLDSTAGIYRDDTGLKTTEGYQYSAAALSEGTITDSTPGSAVNRYTPSVEEGTILSSVSSYRSIAERPPGLCLYHLPFLFFLLLCIYPACTPWDIKNLPCYFRL